ncbi:MAG: iron ABC transporter substrate-binding protein [Erythrobacter sp.]|nr:iron ABC transporter substrate-binding protein [Erythrobacter sp.]
MVSLNPCIDAILLEVADPSQVLAISQLSHDPRSSSIAPGTARRFKAVSGTVEEVVALDPDLVLAGSYLAPATREALSDIGYRTETFGIAGKLSDSHAQVRALARLAGHAARGEALIGRIEQVLADNAPPASHLPISTVLWQPGEIVPGEATLVSDLMRHMGFSSHSAALGMGQGDYLPLEVLLAHPPELLLIAGDARAQHHPALAELTHTRIERLDPSLLYCAGPTIVRTVTRLAQIREAAR